MSDEERDPDLSEDEEGEHELDEDEAEAEEARHEDEEGKADEDTTPKEQADAGEEPTEILKEPEQETQAEVSEGNKEEGKEEAADEADKTQKKPRIKCPEGSIWIHMENKKAPEKFRHKKFLINKETCITDIRKMTCQKVGCPYRELHLEIGGQQQWVGRMMPFEKSEEIEARIKWKKTKRLAKFIEEKKTGGLNGRAGRHKRTILHYTTIVGDLELCEEVLTHSQVDDDLVNVRDLLGDTALTLASIAGLSDIVNLLIEKEADVENVNIKGRNAMLLAAEHGHQDVVQTLLIANASIGPIRGTTRPDALYLAELNQRDAVRLAIKQYLDNQNGDDDFDF